MYAYAANNPVRYIDPDGREIKLGIKFNLNSDDDIIDSQTVKKVTGYCLVALGLVLDKGAPFISASVAVASGGSSAAASPALTIGLKGFGKACEIVGSSLVLEATAEDLASNFKYSSNKKGKKSSYDEIQKQRESAPKKGTPYGTRPLDKANIPKGIHNKIKEGVGNGPRDWTGITPDGDVIINDGYGNAVNCGPYTNYL
ncbi:MAG: hypothetical protein IKQ13_14450 [Treponema sp.]|nr:hypothetical protein [Treponema sp.]